MAARHGQLLWMMSALEPRMVRAFLSLLGIVDRHRALSRRATEQVPDGFGKPKGLIRMVS